MKYRNTSHIPQTRKYDGTEETKVDKGWLYMLFEEEQGGKAKRGRGVRALLSNQRTWVPICAAHAAGSDMILNKVLMGSEPEVPRP